MTTNEVSAIGTSNGHWFLRGLGSGIVLVAATNAVSYFFRTPSIADLIGSDSHVIEAVGFPFEIWREDSIYFGGQFINYANVGLNFLIGLALGLVIAGIMIRWRDTFNQWIHDFEQKQTPESSTSFQFSVRSLLLTTTVVAAFMAVLTTWKGTPEALLAIYFAGPAALVGIAMIPQNIHWHHRIVILTLTAVAMIAIAVWSGLILGVSLDRVLLGIFVSWTPQSAFGAFLLTGAILFQLFRKKRLSPYGDDQHPHSTTA